MSAGREMTYESSTSILKDKKETSVENRCKEKTSNVSIDNRFSVRRHDFTGVVGIIDLEAVFTSYPEESDRVRAYCYFRAQRDEKDTEGTPQS